jgi:hypothetical protein
MENLTRWKQAWTIAKIELRNAFLSKRAFWVYALALFPSVIFLGHYIQTGFQRNRLSAQGVLPPALMDSLSVGETDVAVLKRLGKPARDQQWMTSRRVRGKGERTGITVHKVEPGCEGRFVRLNIFSPAINGDSSTARIYEFEVYGDNDSVNLAYRHPAVGSKPCSSDEGPEKAFNGSVSGGTNDRWCTHGEQRMRFLQVDLGSARKIKRIVLKHASAGGESEDLDTAWFNIQASLDNKNFATIVNATGARLVDEITQRRILVYFDGRREARLEFLDGKLRTMDRHPLLNFEEDRRIFAGVFQYFYLRLAIFFGCLGIFMNLFRGEMLDKTLHFWLLIPARREVLLAGKYGAGLMASTVIFTGGALLCFGILLYTHNPVEVSAYWQTAGLTHAFWYAVAAMLGCVGYGSVFLATGLLLRNPIIPAAVLLGWESINGFLPEILQKLSVLYYLQSLCPVQALKDWTPDGKGLPPLLKLILVPAAPASRTWAILGLFAVTLLVLWIARFAVRRMQISYSSDT